MRQRRVHHVLFTHLELSSWSKKTPTCDILVNSRPTYMLYDKSFANWTKQTRVSTLQGIRPSLPPDVVVTVFVFVMLKAVNQSINQSVSHLLKIHVACTSTTCYCWDEMLHHALYILFP